MNNYERSDSSDSLESLDLDALPQDNREHVYQHAANARVDSGPWTAHHINGQGSDEDVFVIGHPNHGRRMIDEEWDDDEDEANYFHSDEGAPLEVAHYERYGVGNGNLGHRNGFEYPMALQNLYERIMTSGREENDPFNPDTNRATEAHTPNSPSSIHVEPGSSNNSSNTSSGNNSTENSTILNDTCTDYLVCMGDVHERTFHETPGSLFIGAPLCLGPILSLPQGFMHNGANGDHA